MVKNNKDYLMIKLLFLFPCKILKEGPAGLLKYIRGVLIL